MAIWSKAGEEADALVHEFTVGDDWRYDRQLAPYDLLGCLAHATMLGETGIVAADTAAAICAGLRTLKAALDDGSWTVEPADEDVHSKIESLLTGAIGAPAGDLHTGRSRNDQVLTALRLWQKDRLAELGAANAALAGVLLERAAEHEFVPLPGYTHLQRGMPSSLGMFFGGHAQALLENDVLLGAAWTLVDRCPLGSGAGYGVPLPLDRARTAALLGFARSGGIAMADANSRGKTDTACLDAAGATLNDLSRLAADVVFFSTAECGFFKLGEGFTTGSSIMPQKRNPDVFELIRGRCARFLGLRTGLYAVTAGLPSGYSRDLQDSKALVMDGLTIAGDCLAVAAAATPAIAVDRDAIGAALTPELYATDAAYRLMREQGLTFREAYRRIGGELDRVTAPEPEATLLERTHAGATGALGLPALAQQATAAETAWRDRADTLHATWDALLAG